MSRHRLILLGLFGAFLLAGCGGGSSSSGFGKAGDPAKAARTVEVHITSSKAFNPSTISVRSGETVTFKVVNDTSSLHEFVLGDQKAQDDHEKMMVAMPADSMKMADTPSQIDLDGGQSKQLTWTFPAKAGTSVIYGSHVPGDYAGGLKGTITVS